MPGKAFLNTVIFLNGWEKPLFFIRGCLIRCLRIKLKNALACFRMLHCWHDTGLMVPFASGQAFCSNKQSGKKWLYTRPQRNTSLSLTVCLGRRGFFNDLLDTRSDLCLTGNADTHLLLCMYTASHPIPVWPVVLHSILTFNCITRVGLPNFGNFSCRKANTFRFNFKIYAVFGVI